MISSESPRCVTVAGPIEMTLNGPLHVSGIILNSAGRKQSTDATIGSDSCVLGETMSVDEKKILVLYDGECAFCRQTVSRWRGATEDRVDFVPFQDARYRFPDIPESDCRSALQLIDVDGRRYQGAEAVFRLLAQGAGKRLPLFLYRWMPGFAPASRIVYRWVASRRRIMAASSEKR